MIPVEVRHEDVRRERLVAELALQLLAEDAEAGAAVEDVDAVAEADFDAGGVASVAHVFGLWCGGGTTHAPKLDPHRLFNALLRGPMAASVFSGVLK